MRVLDPSQAKRLFFSSQAVLILVVALFLYLVTRKKEDSAFRVREADRKRPKKPSSADSLAEAKMKRVEPLSLPGIRIDGEPHEILGVARDAAVSEIHRAYRDLMKRYHPDAVGRPGTREWKDAQKIAEALNQARAKMLAYHSQSPNRSGR